MALYLVQHGLATTEADDPARPLTEQGRDDVTRVAAHAVEHLGVRPARVIHSGKTRARQTAEIWAALLAVADIEEADGLAPNDDPAEWAERVASAGGADLMLVGHLPHLGRLTGLLLTGPDLGGRSPVTFTPGTLVGLERGEDGWAVTVVLPPR